MGRILIFLSMLCVSIPDVVWGLANLVFAFFLIITGLFFDIMKMKKVGSKFKQYGINIALSVDQFMATKAMGQDPDISISMALGVAKIKHEKKTAKVSKFWLIFGRFVNWLFSFQEDHVVESIEAEEKSEATIIRIYTDCQEEEDKYKEAA